MKLVDAVVGALLALDVRYVFGVSGANIEHLHDAIHRLGRGSLVSVMARSEFGAAFMADGYARVHRRLGVCCATSGGGMMNLAVGIDRLGPVDTTTTNALRQFGPGSRDLPVEVRLGPGVPANRDVVRRGLLALLAALRSARSPVLIVGQGVRRCSNPAAVIDFA